MKSKALLLVVMVMAVAAVACGSEPAPAQVQVVERVITATPRPATSTPRPTSTPRLSAHGQILEAMRAAGYPMEREFYDGEYSYNWWGRQLSVMCGIPDAPEVAPLVCIIDLSAYTDGSYEGSAIRDVMRAYGIPFSVINTVADDIGRVSYPGQIVNQAGDWFYMVDADDVDRLLSVAIGKN